MWHLMLNAKVYSHCYLFITKFFASCGKFPHETSFFGTPPKRGHVVVLCVWWCDQRKIKDRLLTTTNLSLHIKIFWHPTKRRSDDVFAKQKTPHLLRYKVLTSSYRWLFLCPSNSLSRHLARFLPHHVVLWIPGRIHSRWSHWTFLWNETTQDNGPTRIGWCALYVHEHVVHFGRQSSHLGRFGWSLRARRGRNLWWRVQCLHWRRQAWIHYRHGHCVHDGMLFHGWVYTCTVATLRC